MTLASIIIRTKNESRWIKYCLEMVNIQSEQDFEVILVDNQSEDETVEIAESYGVDQFIEISEYQPGYALNLGFEAADGRYGVCLSGHCIPKDEYWLEGLLRNFDDNQVAGVYGRQIPLSYSPEFDKRDLMFTFGIERRVQKKDYFFHNANSAIDIQYWKHTPFDSQISNLEDRMWAKQIIEKGYHLVYEPTATVFHPHGIHHNMSSARARSVVNVLENIEPKNVINNLAKPLRPDQATVAAICPVMPEQENREMLETLLIDLKKSDYIDLIYVIANHENLFKLDGVEFIQRPDFLNQKKKTLIDVLKYAIEQIEIKYGHLDAVLYTDHRYEQRPRNLFDELIRIYQYDGLDSLFVGLPDYANYWQRNGDTYEQVGDGLKNRNLKKPLYKALYGLGTVTQKTIVHNGNLVGKKIGIFSLKQDNYKNESQRKN